MSAAESVVSSIQHYQKSIQKYHGNSSRVIHCIHKLYQLPVTVQHLQDTGVGKTINSLRKSDGEVGEAARALVLKWKQMVEEESEKEQEVDINVRAHSSYDGDSENENPKERFDRQDKVGSQKSTRNGKEQSKLDHGKSHKRKRESEDNYKEKRNKSVPIDGFSNHSSVSKDGGNMNGNNENVCSDEEWHTNTYKNGENNSDDDNEVGNIHIKTERTYSEECNAQSSEDDLNNSECLTQSSDKESWLRKEETSRHNKSSKKEKSSSHKHKSKTSSSSSDRVKHLSSSRSEHKESKSSGSNRHKDDKSSSGSGSSGKKVETSMSEKTEEKKSKEKEKKDKHKDKRGKDEKKSKDKREKEKKADVEEDGVDSFSGKSFGEALGMIFPPDKSRKKSSSGASFSPSPSKKRPKSTSSTSEMKTHLKDNISLPFEVGHASSSLRLEQSLEVDEDYGLPTLNPNYKPLPQPNFFNSPPKRYQNEDDDLSNIMYSKVQRTKVFSGNKSGYTYVPSLFDLCTRVLQENIDALEYTGGVPFDLLKPVLERATPDQLFTLEHFNAYLIEDTDKFWEFHCKKDFRNKKREEMETWREMYQRCREERESKLKSLTANIAAASKAKALPVRKTQLAYIEGAVKPPRNIARKQIKFGTAHASASSSTSKQESTGLSSSFTGRSAIGPSSVAAVAVPTPRGAAGSSHSSSCKPKPKAPLMQKALQLIKYNRFKR